MDTSTAPRITLVMPFRNEARHLPSVLASLSAQTIERARLFFVGVDNGSSDDGAAIVREWLARTGIAGEVIRDEIPSIPRAVNLGMRRADLERDLVVRLDSHTLYDERYVQTIDDAFRALPDDVWCVGGAPTPPDDASDYQIALGIALYSNPFGLGRFKNW